MQPRSAPGTCSIRRAHRTGAATASCRMRGSSGRGASRACTTGCATGSTALPGGANGSHPSRGLRARRETPSSGGFQALLEGLLELRDLGGDHERAVALVRMVGEVVLVVWLGLRVVVDRQEFGDDAAAMRRVGFGQHFAR